MAKDEKEKEPQVSEANTSINPEDLRWLKSITQFRNHTKPPKGLEEELKVAGNYVRRYLQRDVLFRINMSPWAQALQTTIFELVEERNSALCYGVSAHDPELEKAWIQIFVLRLMYERWAFRVIWGDSGIRDCIGSENFYTLIVDRWQLVGIKRSNIPKMPSHF